MTDRKIYARGREWHQVSMLWQTRPVDICTLLLWTKSSPFYCGGRKTSSSLYIWVFLPENILPYQPHQYPQKGCLTWQEILWAKRRLTWARVMLICSFSCERTWGFTGSNLCLKHLMGCVREKFLLDETMTCQFMLCCLLGISLPRDTVEFVKEHSTVTHF